MIATDAPLLHSILEQPKPFSLTCAERLLRFVRLQFDPSSDASWETLDKLWRAALLSAALTVATTACTPWQVQPPAQPEVRKPVCEITGSHVLRRVERCRQAGERTIEEVKRQTVPQRPATVPGPK